MPTLGNLFNSDFVRSHLLEFLNASDRHNLGLTSGQFNNDINQPSPQQEKYLSKVDFKALVNETSDFIKSNRLDQNAQTTVRGNLYKLRKRVAANNGKSPVLIDEIKYKGDEKYLVFAFIFGLKKLSDTAYQHCHLYMSQNPHSDLSFVLPLTDTIPIKNQDLREFINLSLNRLNIALMFLDLRGADFRDIDLSGANLSGANLSGANLSGTNLSGANLSGADLSGADLISANLSGTNLSGANFSGASLYYTNLSGARLSHARFRDVDFSYAKLINANLECTNFAGGNFSGARLSRVEFVSKNLIFFLWLSTIAAVICSLVSVLSVGPLLWLPVALAVLSGVCAIGCSVYYAHRSQLFQRLSTSLSSEKSNDNPVIDLEIGYQRL